MFAYINFSSFGTEDIASDGHDSHGLQSRSAGKAAPPNSARNHDDYPRWWMAPDGKLRQCTEHEFAARAILTDLKLIPASGRAIYDQMFDNGWVRVVAEKSRIYYETSRSLSREAKNDQLKVLKVIALERAVNLYNATTDKLIPI